MKQEIPADLILEAAQGNLEAFRKIYDLTSSFVYNVALRMIKNSAEAEEITQEVFLKVYQNLKNFRFAADLRTWIYRITVNTAINFYRRLNKIKTVDVDSLNPLTLKKASTEQINSEEVLALLDLLNPQQRACLILRSIEGLSYKEIGRILKVNINTVRTRILRARQALLRYRTLDKDAL